MLTKQKNLLATLLTTLMVLSIIMSASPVMAKKSTIDVYPGDSIQNAIDTAFPGATIIVNAGTYSQGPITVNKAVTLLGKDAVIEYTKAATSDRDGALNVLADNVRISGFTIHSAYGTGVGGILSGIEVGWIGTVTSGCEIDNNVIVSPHWGLAGYGQQGVTIKDNVISAQHPIWFTNAIDITIKNNVITAKTYPTSQAINPPNLFGALSAIKVPGCNGALISNNQIDSENYGILAIQAASNVEIKGNQILTSYNGIYTDIGSNFIVKNNVVNAQNYGIWLKDMQGTEAKIAGNSVTSALTMTKYNVIDVYPGGSIQDAINTALPNSKIIVNEGTYQGQIQITKALTLLGKDATLEYTLLPTFSGVQAVVTVLADDVRISGFTIHAISTGTARGSDSAIEVGNYFANPKISTSRCEIDNNVIDSPAWGVSGFGQTSVTIRDNVISARNPIWVTNAVDYTIKNNELTAQTISSSPVYTPSNLNNALSAVKMVGVSTGALIKGNQINSEKYGIQVISGAPGVPSNIEITGNQILTSYNGIYTDIGSNFIVKNNVVNAQNYGIWLNDMLGTIATVKGNTVTSGSTAIYVGNAA